MAEEFFTPFVATVMPEGEAAPVPSDEASPGEPEPGETGSVARVAAAPAAAERESAPAADTAAGRLPPAVWVTGLTAIVALMLYYFTRGGVR
jgi:hypothetical protein